MVLHTDRHGSRNLAQDRDIWNRIEECVDEVLYPPGIEVPGVVLFDDVSVDDALLVEVTRANDGAIGDAVEPEELNLGAHLVALRPCGGVRPWRNIEDEMERLIGFAQRAKS